jgi:hypothetical protein
MRFRRLLLAIALALATATATAAAALPTIVVYKSAYCGCCKLWVEHLRKSGFRVEVRETEALDAVKSRVGVPPDQRSCHTAEIAGYFVEGHVPAADIKRLLKEKPKALGIAVAGMPMGSPGMEMPDGSAQPYTVQLVDKQGVATPFARH